ncbi:MAG TPA: lipoyl(octanoyl) transferase LipB [Candidatus Acidoferrum sp.]|nr:lipoyl(octanoyl) transferase LipB [Candidatus Acidoferrum sp.]
MANCLTVNLGLIRYGEAWELQNRLVAARKADAIEDVLLFCQHPHVITLGRNGKRENLLASEHVLRQKGVEFHATNRGGDITYHGPGQIVGYPILNLGAIRRDVVWYVRTLEEAMIRTSVEFGIIAGREPGKTGVWVDSSTSHQSRVTSHPSDLPLATRYSSLATSEKLGAIGVHVSRWVTSHGFAYNVSTDLRFFDLIVPCGISDRKATSLEKLLGRSVEVNEVLPKMAWHLGELFGLEHKEITKEYLLEKLEHAEQSLAVSA